jgi:6,7-dimethyl-8-ribityllumazine synthase
MVEPRGSPLKDKTDVCGSHVLIVEARFYDDIQDALLEAAIAELKSAGSISAAHLE